MTLNLPVFPDLKGQVAVITGGGGAICGAIAEGLSYSGVRVAIWDISAEAANATAAGINNNGGDAVGISCNVLKKSDVEDAFSATMDRFDQVDILVNGAGGSRKEATTSAVQSFSDIAPEALMDTVALNYAGSVLPCQAVAEHFSARKAGIVLNIASIAGEEPLSRAIGYSNGKAAVISFTKWLAVHMAREYSPLIRVNAISPGFILTEQNRFLLVDEETTQPTDRGKKIIGAVPMGRYGEPEEIVGAALWLVSKSASFVTGAVVAVDGGFTAESGV